MGDVLDYDVLLGGTVRCNNCIHLLPRDFWQRNHKLICEPNAHIPTDVPRYGSMVSSTRMVHPCLWAELIRSTYVLYPDCAYLKPSSIVDIPVIKALFVFNDNLNLFDLLGHRNILPEQFTCDVSGGSCVCQCSVECDEKKMRRVADFDDTGILTELLDTTEPADYILRSYWLPRVMFDIPVFQRKACEMYSMLYESSHSGDDESSQASESSTDCDIGRQSVTQSSSHSDNRHNECHD